MGTVFENHESVPESLRKQLAVVVRSIQWSYAIFWSITSEQPGVLEWGDGCYNGDIKTRKTVQIAEVDADLMGLERSEHLRELYESLAAGENNSQARRPSVALSPEDLADTEWYYLVCMSFIFNVGQGLPGRALANSQPIWLCNAHMADSKVFSRSLLAKSASIQTVICFPFLGGVLELGVTELVMEDPGLIQNIKIIILENPYSTISWKPKSVSGDLENDDSTDCFELDCKSLDNACSPVTENEEVDVGSPEANYQRKESIVVEELNEEASQVHSWHFMDDISNGNQYSMDSSDCISQTFLNHEKHVSVPNHDKVSNQCLKELQDCNRAKLNPLDIWSDDVHYQNILGALLKSSHRLILGPQYRNCNKESSFVVWKKGPLDSQKPKEGSCQKLLKKILFDVPQMYHGVLLEACEDDPVKDDTWRPEADETGINRVLSERRRREKINERFMILKSLVPSISRADKVSILDETIDYLKELKRKVDELTSCTKLAESEDRKAKRHESVNRTLDDCVNKIGTSRKALTNKRKDCHSDDLSEIDLPKDGLDDDVTVSVIERDVLIEIRCQWRESLLLEVMDTLSNAHLVCHTIQSATVKGVLSLTIKSKLKGSAVITVGKLRKLLQSVIAKKF